MAAASMTAVKLAMFVIGKAKTRNAVKGLKSLHVHSGQKNSWMDSELLRELDKMKHEGRKVALVVDNCPAHPVVGNLKSIDLIFSSPNTISSLQPMDQGVIRSLSAKYRNRVIQKLIDAIDNDKPLPAISILEAMKILVLA